MNDQTPTDARELPVLSEASIDRIERAVFDEIVAHRSPAQIRTVRRRRRRRGWLTGIGVAAAFAAGVMVTPPLLNLTQTSVGSSSDATSFVSESSAGSGADSAVPEGMPMDAAAEAPAEAADREIVAGAHATLRVDDVADAVDSITALAEEHGGYAESTDMSAAAMSSDPSSPAPEGEYGWIAIRVPAADLRAVLGELEQTGSVVASSMSQEDVTSMAIDLRARMDAAQASVDRLTELMSQSGSVSDLIDAEVALTERQAQLESYTQQLAELEDQVTMSSLRVQLTESTSVAPAEPDGFVDGLLAGWNGLIVSLNALVIAIGFLLPWLVITGAVVLVVFAIRRRRRRDSQADIH